MKIEPLKEAEDELMYALLYLRYAIARAEVDEERNDLLLAKQTIPAIDKAREIIGKFSMGVIK